MRVLILLLCLPILGFSQKNTRVVEPANHPIDLKEANASFKKHFIGTENLEVAVESFLQNNLQNMQVPNSSLKLESKAQSRGGLHFLFQQYANNKKVYRAQVKVSVNNQGYTNSIFDNTFTITSELSNQFPYQEMIDNWLLGNTQQPEKEITEAVYFYNGTKLIPCARIEITEGDSYYEVILDNDGDQIYFQDLQAYFAPKMPDSTVTAKVFLPDPLTTAGVTYGSPYNDQGDTDVAQLNAERADVTMTVDFNGGVFSLNSQWCEITEHSSPNVPPATSSTPDFSFQRADQAFEDVNVFYHINAFQQHIQNLGFSNLANYAIHCDTHGLNGADNSFFTSSTNPPELTFGEGGVDDAEDADVIIHEYGHAISHSAAPGTNNGSERRALDEANGDYFASSYSRFLDPYKWENVFSWDGHNEFWSGRSSMSSKHYPDDLVFNLYSDADIWSSTLMQLWGDIGRDETDAILMESMYGYASNMTMADAAYLLILADTILYNGANHGDICFRCVERGLLTSNDCVVGVNEGPASNHQITLLNTEAFKSGEQAILQLPGDKRTEVNLYNAEGKLIWDIKTNQTRLKIDGRDLTEGMYLLKVNAGSQSQSFKLIR